jgi:transposase-like protein
MKATFDAPHFQNDEAAREFLERLFWPEGPQCPHCGVVNHAYKTKRAGVYRCAEAACRKDYTVMTKSVMERSHAPLTSWAVAFHMACTSKKGFAAHQLHRELGCEYNTAWFLHHRVMEAMRRGGLNTPPLGGEGKIVEADETYFGDVPEAKRRPSPHRKGRPYTTGGRSGAGGKRVIVSLIERGGKTRSFHVPTADRETVEKIMRDNIAKESKVYTDESRLYTGWAGDHFADHATVNHSAKEYARHKFSWQDGQPKIDSIHVNTAEGFFGLFKRGMRGNYQHCAEKNLHRYVAEFDFRYNTRSMTDGERAVLAIQSGAGKRLTYRQPH